MNLSITVNEKYEPKRILQCAYDALISFNFPKNARNVFVDYNIMATSATVYFVPKTIATYELISIITVNDTFNKKYNVSIIADFTKAKIDTSDGIPIEFATEFVKRFSSNLSELHGKDKTKDDESNSL